jgi:hypothetical protein
MSPQGERLAEFSLVEGSPFDRLFSRLGLSTTEQRRAWRLVAALILLAWVPLLLLSASEGAAWGDAVALPFLHDVEVQVRLLFAVPVLVLADGIVQRRLQGVAQQFIERGLVTDAEIAQFDAALATVGRLRRSRLAEVLMFTLVYGVGVLFVWRTQVALDLPSWYGAPVAAVLEPSRAGWWFGLVSLPAFQFLLLRWFWRQVVWAVFLWKISRIDLHYMPKHPDGAGGIGFLARASYAFTPVLLAQSGMLAGTFVNRIFYTGASFADFRVELAGFVALMLIIVFTPLLFFCRRLEAAKRGGLREYGRLVERYLREFDDKWIRGRTAPGETLVGSGDIQSLADLCHAYSVTREMRWIPFSVRNLFHMGITASLPLLPLSLTLFPLEQLLDQFLKILF